jgi:hypothetical protein
MCNCLTIGEFIGRFFGGCGCRHEHCGCGPKRCFRTEMIPQEPRLVKRCVCHEEEVLVPQPPRPVEVPIECPCGPCCE